MGIRTGRGTPEAVARDLLEEFGPDGVLKAGARAAEDCRQKGDAEGVLFRNAVVRILVATQADEGGDEGPRQVSGRAVWRLEGAKIGQIHPAP